MLGEIAAYYILCVQILYKTLNVLFFGYIFNLSELVETKMILKESSFLEPL